MRLDADLIARTPVTVNCLHDRELDLRGHKIPAIENLGATRDQLDAIDLTDNSISSLSNFPLLRRLQHLHLSNNPIRTISPSVPTSLPNLRSLILQNCALAKESLGSVGDVLARCRKLETVVLKGADVTQAKHYREWIVFKCKKLRSLDYERVKEKERTVANSLFMTPQGAPTALAVSFTDAAAASASQSHGLAKTFEPGQGGGLAVEAEGGSVGGKAGRLLTKEEKDRVRAAIEAAESVDEIRRLQRMLGQGFVPTERDLKELARKKGPTAMDQD